MTTTQTDQAAEIDATTDPIFAFFNEIGIINQLSSALLSSTLPDGVHPSHFSILNHLARMGDGRTPIRIAGAMQVTKNTMTHSLKVLESRGFIEVRANPEDGRGKLVFLTEAGRAFRDRAIADVVQRFEGLFDENQRADMAALRPGLVSLRKHLDANRS
ncbi:MAG: MarR family transcriptional regulator [Pseudomonadota bacterium]